MRTTVNLNGDLLERAKALAHARHQTVGEIITEGLRVVLFQNAEKQADKSIWLVTFRGNGTCPGVALDSSGALLDAMEAR